MKNIIFDDEKIDLKKIIDCVKKVYPFTFERYKETCYDKKIGIILDRTLLKYNDFYYNDVIKFVAKNSCMKNPIPMVTQSYQINQDSGEGKTWQVENFDVNLAGLWIKEKLNNCEYCVKCDSYVRNSNFLEFQVKIDKEYFEHIDSLYVENIIESALVFFKQRYDLSVELFVKNLYNTFNISTKKLIDFFERLSKYNDIKKEFFKVFTSGVFMPKFPRKKSDFNYGINAVTRQGLTAIDLFEKYNLSAIDTYNYLIKLAEEDV